MYRVIEHRARKYLDTVTGKIHIAPMPDGIRKGGLLGAGIIGRASALTANNQICANDALKRSGILYPQINADKKNIKK